MTQGQVFASSPSGPRCGFTTQKRWPVGASITHQRFTKPMRFAPSFSSRATSASVSGSYETPSGTIRRSVVVRTPSSPRLGSTSAT